MDRIDKKLLKLLQKNARMTSTALGKEVGLSRTAAQERIAKLEHNGVIAGYTAKLGSEFWGNFHKAVVSVQIETRPCSIVLSKVVKLPSVVSCYSVAGEVDAFLIVAYESPRELTKLIDEISDIDGVGLVNSHVVLADLLSHS